MADPPRSSALLRDLLILHLKLWMDGLKDVVLAPVSIGAATLDLLLGPRADGRYRFYRILRLGERFDLWLNLYAPLQKGEQGSDGLFGGSHPGDGTFVGELERLRGQPPAPLSSPRERP